MVEISALKLAEKKLVELSGHGYVALTSQVTRLNISYSDLLDEYGIRLNVVEKAELRLSMTPLLFGMCCTRRGSNPENVVE